jgi:hypothetical protein
VAKQEALDSELVEIEDREAQLGVRKSVVRALIACGAEPPAEGGEFEQWSSCLYRELHPAEAVAPANGESEPERSKVAAAANGKLHPGEPEASEPSKAPESSKAPPSLSW